jgi:hypothetical protein
MEKIENPALFQLQFFARSLEVLDRLGLLTQQKSEKNDSGD